MWKFADLIYVAIYAVIVFILSALFGWSWWYIGVPLILGVFGTLYFIFVIWALGDLTHRKRF